MARYKTLVGLVFVLLLASASLDIGICACRTFRAQYVSLVEPMRVVDIVPMQPAKPVHEPRGFKLICGRGEAKLQEQSFCEWYLLRFKVSSKASWFEGA